MDVVAHRGRDDDAILDHAVAAVAVGVVELIVEWIVVPLFDTGVLTSAFAGEGVAIDVEEAVGAAEIAHPGAGRRVGPGVLGRGRRVGGVGVRGRRGRRGVRRVVVVVEAETAVVVGAVVVVVVPESVVVEVSAAVVVGAVAVVGSPVEPVEPVVVVSAAMAELVVPLSPQARVERLAQNRRETAERRAPSIASAIFGRSGACFKAS
ncbi:hypothetical protein [Nannocystis exedens]|uniref:hypothetical protein n=1 Tax=Nannocystis exedens TaxID=54 RepID=UPI0011604BDA|nr:hypothetical protein [Nannocystis exedens]